MDPPLVAFLAGIIVGIVVTGAMCIWLVYLWSRAQVRERRRP